MAKAQQQQADHTEAYKLVNTENGKEWEFPEWQDAQDKLNEAVEEFPPLEPDDFRIAPVTNAEETNTDMSDETDESGDPESIDKTEFDQDVPEETPPQPTEVVGNGGEPVADTAPVVTDVDSVPKLSPVEDTARQVISQLNRDDMHRLVWDPDADPETVPYKVSGIPYDRPEPSSEAFDLFAGIIEGAQDIQYSTESVDFEETDKTYGCTVVIEKQTDMGTKRLVGIKTRQKSRTTGIDHWRERIYSKARRNALKQDIPPTMISSLLARYREVNQ